MKFKVERPKYDDSFIFLVVEDKTSNQFRLVNLTSKTILTAEFESKDKAREFLENVKDWKCTLIEE